MLSLSPLTVLPCSPLEQIDAAHAAGFDAVGLRLIPVMDTDVEIMSNAGLRRAIQQRLQSTGLKVLDVEVARIGAETDVYALRPVLEFAHDLGAKAFAVTSLPRDQYDPPSEPQISQKLAELCELASRNHIRVMLEFMVFRGVATIGDAVRIVQQVAHPAMGICVDALHLARSGGSPSDIKAIDPALLHCVQLCDAPLVAPHWAEIPREARNNRLLPGQGGLPLRELLEVVPRSLPLSVEAPMSLRTEFSPLELAHEAARSVRKLLATRIT